MRRPCALMMALGIQHLVIDLETTLTGEEPAPFQAQFVR
jgi:hypothetical protein